MFDEKVDEAQYLRWYIGMQASISWDKIINSSAYVIFKVGSSFLGPKAELQKILMD